MNIKKRTKWFSESESNSSDSSSGSDDEHGRKRRRLSNNSDALERSNSTLSLVSLFSNASEPLVEDEVTNNIKREPDSDPTFSAADSNVELSPNNLPAKICKRR